jgi:cysteine desulfuration protein SufE
MTDMPLKLQETVELIGSLSDRNERIEALVSLAERFRPVPPEVARRPFPEEHRVPACESETFVWATSKNGGVELHFAVESPQGVSAMALCAILQETVSGLPADEIERVPDDLVFDLFGTELSMGKSMGLMGVVRMSKALARRVAAERQGEW